MDELHDQAVPAGQSSTEEAEWAALTTEQFLQGYSDADAVYDDAPTEVGDTVRQTERE